jgi:hypothetical protein
MGAVSYEVPGKRVLEKFGFSETGMIGFYHASVRPGVLSILIFSKGDVSIVEETDDDDEDSDECDQRYRVRHLRVDNDRELEFILKKALI